jgi:hypothetical protein
MQLKLTHLSNMAIPPRREEVDMAAFQLFNVEFHNWIHSSRQKVKGLPLTRMIVSGITDALNQTYALYNRIGIFDGEYGYHLNVLRNRITYDLNTADVIIVSHPFSADGMSSHDRLAMADVFNKPIFVDCAFFGICGYQDFDFTPYKNIHSVCFSLSKSFGTGLHRVGMLYTKDRYAAATYNDWSYPLVAEAEHHYGRLYKQSPDFMYDHFKEQQKAICAELKILPSDTVIFGIDIHNRFGERFKRGGYSRICISRLFTDA